MTTQPAQLNDAEPDSEDDDPPPSASARFRLVIDKGGGLKPVIVPVDGGAPRKPVVPADRK